VQINVVNWSEAEHNLDASISALHRSAPDLSAQQTLARRQRHALLVVVVLAVLGAIINVTDTLIAIASLITALYVAIAINRAVLFSRSRREHTMEQVSDADARAVPDDDLPSYTILVPALREPEVIATLLRNLDALEYPQSKLDIKLILESGDSATIEAATEANPGDHVELVLVPPAGPRTKPKALNYALPHSRGDLLTIYDAEDEPEPLQLRRAAVALGRAETDTVCLQAQLSFANVEQNIITRWFTLEYDMWFALLLPGLVSVGAPLPLGGTSNHFRRDALLSLGAWDPYNVTEDADLGVRLARAGYRCGVLESTTLEEANSDFINWVKQRSRWYKGYLQTALIHLRNPRLTLNQLGWGGFAQLILFMLGTPLLAVLNPIFWVLTTLWFLGSPHFIKDLFPAVLYYPAVASWVFGNLLVLYMTILTCRMTRRPELIVVAVLVPVYWVMMSMAAIKALWQLIAAPAFWEKTVHGLVDTAPPPDSAASPSPAG
jgi:cellulose synthase/poly-beta-1,6-N-acetylglucosamine synthase-like glycosyltransferase